VKIWGERRHEEQKEEKEGRKKGQTESRVQIETGKRGSGAMGETLFLPLMAKMVVFLFVCSLLGSSVSRVCCLLVN
jgi:hypothetical protein